MPTQETVAKQRTAALISVLKKNKYDPLEELIEIAQDPDATPMIRKDIALAIMPYCYPKLKHVEIDANVNHGLQVQVTQFFKNIPNLVNVENQPDVPKALSGAPEPIGTGPITVDAEPTGEELVRRAQLPTGAGGHPDIIPDPPIPTKGKKGKI